MPHDKAQGSMIAIIKPEPADVQLDHGFQISKKSMRPAHVYGTSQFAGLL